MNHAYPRERLNSKPATCATAPTRWARRWSWSALALALLGSATGCAEPGLHRGTSETEPSAAEEPDWAQEAKLIGDSVQAFHAAFESPPVIDGPSDVGRPVWSQIDAAGVRVQRQDRIVAENVAMSFYAAMNAHHFESALDFAGEDWDYIDPLGNWFGSRDSAMATLGLIHSTALREVSFDIDRMELRFATDDVVIVTSTHSNSPFTAPDGIRHEHQRMQSTSIIARRDERWQLLHTHFTRVAGT
jgi:ketosteroid isomerase-like protein